MTAVAVAALSTTACNSTKNIHRMAGDQRVESGIESRKYQDSETKYYAIVVGEHGDEMEARSIAVAEASLAFAAKSEAITNAALKIMSSNTMDDKVGERNIEAVRSVLNKAVINNMLLEEDALYMNQEKGTYKYRAAYSVDVEEIIKKVQDVVAYSNQQ